MSPQNDPKNDEMRLAEEFDEFLTAEMNGKDVPIPADFSASEVEVAAMLAILVDSAKQLQPNPTFAQELEAKLLGTNVVEASEMFQDSEEPPTIAVQKKLRSSQSRIPSLNLFKQASKNVKLSFVPSSTIRRFSFAAIVLLSISSVVVASTPALRSFAQSIFENFTRIDSDIIGNKPASSTHKNRPITEKERQKLEQKLKQKFERQQRTSSTLAEMEKERGYDLKEPTFIPAGYVLDEEIESPLTDLVISYYKNPQNNAEIAITQKRLDGEKIIGPTVFIASEKQESNGYRFSLFYQPEQPYMLSNNPGSQPIGASAKIESLSIGSSTAEYVEGAWDWDMGMQWNQNAPLRQLQWKEGNMLYHIASTNELSRGELVAIANSMN